MDSEEYMRLSATTTSAQDEDQRSVSRSKLLDAALAATTGNICDRVKRQIFYKDKNAEDRYQSQATDIHKIETKIMMLKDDPTLLSQWETDLLHGALGLASETGEVMEMALSGIIGGETDIPNLKEEVGDILFYLAILARCGKFSIEDAMNANIEKLKARYPDGFTTEAAKNRDLEKEREILEK